MTTIRLAILSLLLCGSFALAQAAADDALIQEGRTIFREVGGIGCAACHGTYALGDLQIGPVIRGVNEVRIEGALDGVEEMEFLISLISKKDITALAAYLGYLGTLEPASVTFRQGEFDPAELQVAPETQLQLIVTNLSRSDCTFSLEGVDLEPIVVPGRDANDLVWHTPVETRTLTAGCQEEAASFSIRVEPPAE
ncbi:MAG: hypothetical protein JSV66_17045 [Trueperaceae bacterium]|nr:MAG: hypothetical protein JSV66_17045 [Trueperaceae bacterium]